MRRAAIAVAVLALLLGTAGCGGGEEGSATTETTTTVTETEPSGGNAEAGKDVFASAGCGGCHTLSEAGSSGKVGPVLDGKSLSVDRVREQVENGRGAMPAFRDQLSEQQIADVAAFVSEASQS